MKALFFALVLFGVWSAPAPAHKTVSISKRGKYSAKATYLILPKDHALAKVVNKWAQTLAQREVRDWVAETLQGQKDFPQSPLPWEFDMSMESEYLTASLASIRVDHYDYSGGAHPNHGSHAFNFWISSGKPVLLKLKDLFASGFDSKSYVTRILLEKLQKMEGADLVQSGELKEFEQDELNRFFLSPTAVTWHFNPYEVGPYAAGDFDVKVSLNELGPSFRRAILMAR